MEGSLLQRGVGWYLQFEDTMQEIEDVDGPFWTGNVNPGHVMGFGLGAIYVASPVDFIPDFIPIIGYVDDAVVLNASTSFGGWLWDVFD